MKSRRFLVLLAAATWLAACSDSTEPESSNNDLRGQVVDALGQPVAGATVVLQYETDLLVGSVYDKPATTIGFALHEAGPVTVWIGSYCDGDTLRLLWDGLLPAGMHEIRWDGRDDTGRTLPDGVYRFHLVTTAGEDQDPLPLFHLGYQNLPEGAELAPLAVTDALGRFSLSQACLPLGFTFDAVNEMGEVTGTNTITRAVRVWVQDPQTLDLFDSPAVTVDPQVGAEVTVIAGT